MPTGSRDAYCAGFLSWLHAAGKQGFLSSFGEATMILPEWLGSVGYASDGDLCFFRFDRPEIWIEGASGCCVLPYGVVFSFGFAGAICLFVPFPPDAHGVGRKAVLVNGRRIPAIEMRVPDFLSGIGMLACLFVLKGKATP